MSHVDLGFAEKSEPWQVESYLFPSKIGGKPAWLALQNLPKPDQLQCDSCKKPLIFLCQVYAPFEEDPSNFHRTIFIFICRDPQCCVRNSSSNVKAFRSSLARHNKFYSSEPQEQKLPDFSLCKWTKLCVLCGCLGEKKCSKCKETTYCSREHQILDWREGHKIECGEERKQRLSSQLFEEFEIVIEAEELPERNVNEEEELHKFNQLENDGKVGTMNEITDSEFEQYAAFDTDKAFAKFKKRIAGNSDQVLRYQRGGNPLWIANEPKPETIPNCEYCGEVRQFEFQIMPQLLSILRENELDIGVIAVYTCRKSCTGDDYRNEFIFKQDVALRE